MTFFRDSWWADLKTYYGTPANVARELGTRYKGRRPIFPASRTCPDPPRGKMLDEIWTSSPRKTPEEKEQFWRDVGPWFSFRQCVRNRARSFRSIADAEPMRFLEWGAGVCPASYWLLTRSKHPPALVVVADVESEHFTFGFWRLQRVASTRTAVRGVILSHAEPKPLCGELFQVAAILETLEHVPNPLETIRHIAEHVLPGGQLYEDFRPHGPGDEGAPWDLPEAQAERPEVYRYLEKGFDLVEGQHWDTPDGGGTRSWRRHLSARASL